MTQTIDTLITFSIIAGVMLIGVLASAVYEKWQERNKNDLQVNKTNTVFIWTMPRQG